MLIIVNPFNVSSCDSDHFKVKEMLYKSLCGSYIVRVEDITGEELIPYKNIDGINFKWWKYKDWKDEWILINSQKEYI